MRIFYWNINGVVKLNAQPNLRELVQEFQPEILCIAEPKVRYTDNFISRLNLNGFKNTFIHNSSNNSIGNIWIFWLEDFNDPLIVNMSRQAITMALNEKKGGVETRTSIINKFSDWMKNNNLFEADSLGCNFTWTNGQSGHRRIINKLDRAIINPAWLAKFENWQCKALPREVSDHSTLIGFPFAVPRLKRAPFRVQKMWFLHADFMRIVSENWNLPVFVNPNFIVTFKLKRLKVDMNTWNLRVFVNIHSLLKQDKLRFETAAMISDEDPSNIPNLNAMKDAMSTLHETKMQHTTMLKQKARNNWLVDGASNTSFFHNCIRARRSNNVISELVDNEGAIISDSTLLRNHVVTYYEEKFNGTEDNIDSSLFYYEHETITPEESLEMDVIPSQEEIKSAVWDLGADSAPGPNGYSGCFYRHCWDVIHEALIQDIIYCWNLKHIPNGTNSSLLIILDKVRWANTIRNFRPISLSKFFFKIFTKILATRLGIFLDKLVSEEHVTFMKGRNIHENISLASEMVNELHIKRKDGNLGLKLDISQAFDTVSWSFVLEVFKHINMGLKQGDPLYPLIFVLIEDVLSRNISKLFNEGNMKSLHNIIHFLEVYQRASGQTVCRQKSKVYYGGGSLSRCRYLTDFSGMTVATFPDRYLGVQVKPGTVRYRHISNVIDKIKNELAGWKGSLLSFQDRIVLVKSVISSYSIHNMAVYKWPRGLGISSMSVMNRPFLMKLWWQIRTSKKKWARYLVAKFFDRNGELKHKGIKSTIFPEIRSIASILQRGELNRNVRVSEILVDGAWVISDVHRLFLEATGIDLINLPRPNNGEDVIIWMPDYKGKFTVRSAREITRPHLQEAVEVIWWVPDFGNLLLCCEGAAVGNHDNAGSGVVARDSDCAFLGAISFGLGVTTNYLAEVYAVVVGFEWANKWGVRRVIIRTDSDAARMAFSTNSMP
ncbi:uncharacterized protein LOC113290706 [Papaver somniferum]|uniref:uncharacterized protein LOC113290706 n=1 Tax=Papaver somniferum TaxID=3469 RepID=UPI000E6FEF1D|nr:uncharacterized protein LOC113290706 [Papaver somniferum]